MCLLLIEYIDWDSRRLPCVLRWDLHFAQCIKAITLSHAMGEQDPGREERPKVKGKYLLHRQGLSLHVTFQLKMFEPLG